MKLSNTMDTKIEEFIVNLSRGTPVSSYQMAVLTTDLVKEVVELSEWGTAAQLIDKVRAAGHRLEESLPNLHIIQNIIRRILKLIREEYLTVSKSEEAEFQQESLQKMLKSERQVSDYDKNIIDLKERVFEIIDELLIELEVSCEEISKQALEHIHANEIIMTIGKSRTVEKFLKYAAARNRTFQVIVAECAPSFSGQEMAASLAKSKISTTVITDSAIFAMMARVNKVIIGTSSILADGGLTAVSGSQTVALAARHYSVPLIVLGAVYKLSPTYLPQGDIQATGTVLSPGPVLGSLESQSRGKIKGLNPAFDYVPPDLVTLFISNLSGYSPSYVYRQIAELYHQQDYSLH